MRTIKILIVFTAIMLTGKLFAQSIDEGKKFLYYERYNSAKDVFNKLVTANPNNIDAVYWLGQTLIAQDDVAGAKAVYQKALNANPSAPLLLVAMGHIALLENNTSDARNRFETAISLTKGKDANVLHAIGIANVDAKAGDIPYAIEKLKQAAERNPKNPAIQITLGDAYRKMTDGANAQLSYQAALAIDPNNAKASFQIGRIYQTQGLPQEAIYMKYYEDAMRQDPNFAPVYAWLSEYYYRRDINKARDYLDKYIAVADADTKNCYYQASFLYASGKFQDAITKADQCIGTGGANPYPKIYGLKAYSYDKLGDSANAKANFETYFAKLPADQLGPNDYATYGRILLKFPGNENLAAGYIQKAVALDSIPASKVEYLTGVAASYMASKNYAEAAKWYAQILPIKNTYGKVDLYNAGYNYYRAGNYKAADSIFSFYTNKYNNDLFGWYMRARSSEGIDSTGANGLAKPYYETIIKIADTTTDKEKVKAQLLTSYRYMVAYYYNTKKDKATACDFTKKILIVDPADKQALENAKALCGPDTKVKVKGNDSDSSNTKVKVKTK